MKGPGCRRKRCIIWAVVPENWHHCHPYIHRNENPNPPNHRDEYAVVDVEQKNDEASKEQEQREVYQRRQCFNGPRKMHLVQAFSKKSAQSCSLLRAAL